MIKAIMLTFEPVMTWEKIILARRSFPFVLFVFLTPLILITLACEMAGIIYFGRHIEYGPNIKFSPMMLMTYAGAQLALSYGIVLIGAKLIKGFAETFHSRNTYSQAFTVVAYGLSPLFLLRVLDAFPSINPWASFGIGISLCVATLYHGVPRVLQPDPPNAFGIYLMSAILLSGVAGLARFLTLLLLLGKIKLS